VPELDEPAVQQELARRLAAPGSESGGVVWVKDGDEVIIWLDSLTVRLEPGTVQVHVDLESGQTGRVPMAVVIAVAEPQAQPSLLAVTDDTARGDERLAARWGQTLQDAVWGTLLAIAGEGVAGIAATDRMLLLRMRESG
jgi:hypothetical protein